MKFLTICNCRSITYLCQVVLFVSICSTQVALTQNEYSGNIDVEDVLNTIIGNEASQPHSFVATTVIRINNDSSQDRFETKRYEENGKIDISVEVYYSNESGKDDIPTSKQRKIWTEDCYLKSRKGNDGADPHYYVGLGGKTAPSGLQKSWVGLWADGIMTGDADTVAVVMKESGNYKLISDSVEIDGHRTYLIESINDRGHYKLWIDPKCGYCPRQIQVKRTENDLYYDKAIGDLENECLLTDITIENKEGRYVVTNARLDETIKKNGEVVFKTVLNARRKEVVWNPDFKVMGAFIMDEIPDGARVAHLDFPGIRFIWNGTKAIVDIGNIEILEGLHAIGLGEPTNQVSDNNLNGLDGYLDDANDVRSISEEGVLLAKNNKSRIAAVMVIMLFVFCVVMVARRQMCRKKKWGGDGC